MTQQVEARPTPSKKPKEQRSSPRLPKISRAGLSKEDAEWTQEKGWFDLGLGEGSSDSGGSTEKGHLEGCRRAAAERTKPSEQGFAMTGKEYWTADAEARPRSTPWEICIHVTVTGFNKPLCWKGLLLV